MYRRALITASLKVLWLLAFVSCHRHGRGQTGSTSGKKLSIVEPRNDSPVEVMLEGEITIKCVATGFSPEDNISVYWEIVHGPTVRRPIISKYTSLLDSDKYEVSSGSSKGDDVIDEFYLTIKDITYDDEGGYNCYLLYNTQKIESMILLRVDGAPAVGYFTDFLSIRKGDTVNITCHFIAKPRPFNTSYWAMDGVEIFPSFSPGKYHTSLRPRLPSHMLGYGEFHLQIKDAQLSDAGNYTCVVINDYGQDFATIQLQVTSSWFLPDHADVFSIKLVSPKTHTLTKNLNTELKIVCAAGGFTEIPTMKWIFFGVDGTSVALSPDEELMFNSVTIKTFSTQNATGCFYTLYVNQLLFSNSGTFVCKMASNESLLAVDYLNLTVTGTPIVESTDFVWNATLGQKVTMKCHIWASPLPYHTAWYLENKILSSTSRFKTTITELNPIQQDAILEIMSVQDTDFGVYACRAYNSRGYAMAIHILQDVDECSYNPPCNHGCMNLLGSYQCLCDDGYEFTNGSKSICKDIDECNIPNKQACDQICTNINGSYFCSCKDGYTLAKNKYDCTNDMEGGDSGENNSGELEITPETLYTVIGVCAGGLLAIVLLILGAVYCRRRKWKEEDFNNYKAVFSTNTAYDSSMEKDPSNLNSYLSNIKNATLKDEFPRQRLQLGIDLGQGRFGKVMMARALNITGSANWEMVAVKTSRDSASDCEKEDLIQELDIMRKIPKHKNIVAYLGCCTKQDPAYILMEYVKGGNLQRYLRLCRPSQQATTSEEITPPSAKDLKMIALQIARGMSHLHTTGIIHRDLSARNIMITPELSCKICDFGLSRDVEGYDVYERSSKGPLPIRWMAPESLNDQCFTKKSDVWSYGVLLWEIVTLGATPYPGMSVREVIQDVTMGKWLQKPLHCKQELYLLMSRCWGGEASCRPSFKEIVCDIESLLSQEAEYIEFNTYEEEKYNVLEIHNSDERV